MIAYKINGQLVNNIFLALDQSWKTGAKLEFYCNDHLYDQYDWTQEPEPGIDQLMTAHAQKLRDQYDRLILLWSGGTDSHTIYNIFSQARIHIDEIIIKTSDHSWAFPECNHEWLQKNHWDPTTTITNYDDHDLELRAMDIPDEDWVWRDKGDLFKYGMTSSGDGVKFLCEKNHAGHNWIALAGYEKPRLIYRAGKWYSRQLDTPLRPTMGHDYIHHFFLDPLIHIKQSHLVKKAVKRIIQNNKLPLYDNDWAEAKWDRTHEGYRQWALACGRHDEVTYGVSNTQKIIHDDLISTEINPTGNWKNLKITNDHKLMHDIDTGKTVAINYIKGYYNLQSNREFVNWMDQNQWFKINKQCFSTLKHVWSKEYNLGS